MFNNSSTARLNADPRSKFLLVVVCNVIVMSAGATSMMWLVLLLAAVLLVVDVRPRVALGFTASNVLFWAATQLPTVWHHGFAVLAGITCYWLVRFGVSLSLGTWFIASTRVSDILAAMNAARLPRFLVIPLSVLFRFMPVAVDETTGVVEAMRLRGYTGSYVWRHPFDGVEKLVVPVLAASARIADDLSAAALIRGLGSSGRPTVVSDLRFRTADAVVLGLVVIVLVYRFGVTA